MKICEYRFDSTINSNLLPRFNSSYAYTVSEQIESNNIIKRTIESDTYPTSVTFSGEQSLIELLYLDATKMTQLVQSFHNCTNLTYLSLTNTEKVTDINHMCYGCANLTEVRFVECDFSKIANITNVFNGGATNSVQKLDLTGAKLNNTSKGIIGALRNASTMIVDKINTDNVTSMIGMFEACVGLVELDLSNANMSNVTDLGRMLYNCPNLKKFVLKNKTLNNVTSMSGMLRGCPKLTEVDFSGFKVPNVTNLSYMFFDSPNLKRVDLSDLGATKVSDLSYMFGSNSRPNITHINLSGVKTVPTVNISHTFFYCLSLEWIDLSNLDISGSTSTTNFFSSDLTVLKEMGACYCSPATINKLTGFNGNCNYNLYYTNASPSELTPRNNCTFVYYDEYKTNVLYLPLSLTLRSNGDIHDEYNPFTSQFVQRIGEDGSVLENPVIATVKSIVAHNDTVKYGYALPDKTTDLYHPEVESYEQVIDSATLNGTENWTKVNQTTFTTPFINAKSETSTEVFTMKGDVESITIVNDTLSLVFKETSYVATNNITVNALKIWLQTNNIEFKYELKDHVFTNMVLEEFDFDNAHFVKPQAYKGGTTTQSNKDDLIFAPITYQTKSNNRYELPLLDSNSDYTLHYEGSVSEVDLGGSTNSSVESNSLVQSGSSDKVVLFDDEVTNVMLIKGDVREQTIPYFQGLLSTQAPVLKAIKADTDKLNTIPFSFFEKPAQDKRGWCSFVFDEGFNGRIRVKLKPDAPSGFRFVCFASKETAYTNAVLKEGIDIEVNNASYIGFHDPNNSIVTTNKGNLLQLIRDGDVQITLQEKGKPAIYAYANTDDVKSSILSTPKDLELHSVGDDCDVLDCKTGELHRYYGKLIIDGSEKFEWHGMNDGVYGFNLSQNEVNKKLNNRINPHKPSTCNSLEYRGSTMYNKKGEGFAISDADHAIVQVQLSLDRLPKLSEDGLRQYLSENPLHLIVPLLNPIVETVDLGIEYKEGDKKYIVRTHDDVTHVNVSSEGLVPITEIGYITNEDNVETVTLEGEMVTLENAKANSVIQRAFMTGYALLGNVATIDTLACYNGATISGETITLDRTRGSSLVQVTGANKIIKANTKYLCILHDVVGDMTGVHLRVQHETTVETVEFVNNKAIFTAITPSTANCWVFVEGAVLPSGGNTSFKWSIIEYQDGIENLNIPYFNDYGMRSAKMPVLTTTGKNLFDGETERGFIDFDTGNNSNAWNGLRSVGYTEVIGGNKINIYVTNSSWASPRIFEYDKAKNFIKSTGEYSVVLDNATKFVRFDIGGNTDVDGKSQVMLYYGEANSSTTYEPYKSNILTVNEPVKLRGIGKVKDELNLTTGELTERIGYNIADGVNLKAIRHYPNDTDYAEFHIGFSELKKNAKTLSTFSPSYLKVQRPNNAESFWANDMSGAIGIVIQKTKLPELSIDGLNEYLKSNPIEFYYELETESIKTVDLTLTQQNVPSEKMTYFKDYYGQLVSDGTLPKFTYRLESTNTYNVSQLKPNTLYTMYSEGEATVATLGGKASILLNNPQTLTSGTQNKSLTFDSPTSKVVLIEKDVTNQVVPYFTGTLDTVNPIIKTTSGNKSNTVSTNVHLRSVGDICDTYDLNTGTLVKRVGEDHRVLDHPETSNIPVNTPVAYHGATVGMSSNELSLLPRFEYSCKSPNYYPLPVESNEVYTLKFDKTSNGTLTMGGVTANTTGNQTVTTKNSDVQGVLFSGDLGIGNLMVMKTDVRNVPTPYFRGIRSVVNPTITVSDGGTQSNSVALTLTMRGLPNGVKDELNLVTGEYVQRLDQRNFTEGDVNSRDMITDGTTTIYPLTVPRRSTLELNWSDGVLTAYDGTTNVTTEAELLKPHLFFQLATSTLEEIISQLKDENASLLETVATLEEDNLSTMVAVTEVFEAVLVMMPMTLDVNSNTKGGGSYMVEVYVTLILKGKKTLEQVPAVIRPQVEQMLKDVDAL